MKPNLNPTSAMMRPKTVNWSWFTTAACVTVLLTLVWGCMPDTPDSFDTEYIQQVERTKREHKVSDLKAAAREFASNPNGPIPKEVSSLPVFSDLQNYINGASKRTNLVQFFGGGPLYHGIIIVLSDSESSQQFLNNVGGTIIPWEDGVYFWAAWRVGGVPKEYWHGNGK